MRGLFLAAIALGSVAQAGNLLVLPIAGDTAGSENLRTLSRLYREELEARHPEGLASGAFAACRDPECARAAASAAGAEEVVYSEAYPLGSRWIFTSTALTLRDGSAFHQRLTALSVEDFDAVARRMAEAVSQHKSVESIASLDNSTQREAETGPERRRSVYSSGGSLGFLWPLGSSFSYQRYIRTSIGRYGPTDNEGPITHVSWMNAWELKRDLFLNGELAFEFLEGAPVVGGDLTLDHLFFQGDVAPFAGAGMGLHYVPADEDHRPRKRNSGPTLNAETGLMLFRTYDLHVLLRGRYRLILNTDVDQGFVTDVAVTYKMKRIRENAEESRMPVIAKVAAAALFGAVMLWFFSSISD